MKKRRSWALLLCVALLVSLRAAGQSADATLSGAVTDPSGLPVAGARIIAKNLKTGVLRETHANESGVYLFPALQPGTYRITVEQEGFRKFIYNEVELEVGGRLSLNLPLEIGALTQTVEVTAESESLLASTSISVGGIVTGQKVRDLPLTARNALGLVYIHAGVVSDNFSGARRGTLNITLDAMNVQDNRLNSGVASPIFASVDRVEEFRVTTSPADAELGRGSGQVQIVTRSGTNAFRGSVFEHNRNTVLTANTWFNNQRGRHPETGEPLSPRNFLNRNQYGGRVGGPILRNRTFFHATFESQRIRTRDAVTSTTYTETARRGIFRFFPGAQNANAGAARPTVDLAGNPLRPAAATGELAAVPLFGRDPNRSRMDPSGVVPRLIGLMPLPNNFRSGDGLNTAGYTWQRVGSSDFDQFTVRVDHYLGSAHRASINYTFEDSEELNGFLAQPFPQSPGGDSRGNDQLLTFSLTSTLRPNLVNEFRAGALRPRVRFRAPWELDGAANAAGGAGLLPKAGEHPYLVDFGLITDPINQGNDPQGRISPVYTYSDNISWLKERHSFKGGAEVSFVSTNGFNSFDVMPRAVFGTGGVPIQGISTIPGIGQNQAGANSLLNELSGSLVRINQAFNSPGGASPQFLAGEPKQRTWRQRQLSFFFKDDFKVTQNLTLNLGVRYEWYGVPWEANGKAAALAGGSASIFGISGSSFADLFQPGRLAGGLTRVEQVGRNSPNERVGLYGNDNNNFAPAAGLTWSLPWFGRNKTVLRMGYGVGYERNSLRIVDVIAGDLPGLRERPSFTSAAYLDLSRVRLPIAPTGRPFDVVPLTDRVQTVRTFDSGLRSPYVQNWNLTLQRALTRNTVLDVRYVGNKGTRLVRGASINEENIFETGILDAFRVTQAGGNSPLLDQIFRGITVPGLGLVDGVNISGSQAVRFITSTQANLASHSVAGLADYLNTTDQFTGERGGLLRRAGLPENWIVANPQFASARLSGNFAGSTYHSLQVEVNRRFATGWTVQGNYTWSRALGEEEGDSQEQNDSYRNLRNRRLDKRLLSFHRTHVFRNNATWDLPLGPGKLLGRGLKGPLARVLEGWKVSTIFNLFSGGPVDLVADLATWNTFGDNTPVAVAPFSKASGGLRRTGQGVSYFDELRQVTDPSVEGLTTLNNIRGRSTLRAITDASGRLLLVNPTPGVLGNLAQSFLEGPGSVRFDLNLVKQIRISENKSLEVRADAINVTNSPDFNNPNTDINSPNFGRITGTGAGTNRVIVVGIRFNF